MSDSALRKTPLHNLHKKLNAKMVDFAGWDMPLLYTGIVEEHRHTRTAASIFDVSHMGRIEFTGAEAESLLQRVCTRQLGDAAVGQSRYSHVCNESGGILDDVIVSRFEKKWLMVCNASNRDKILAWLHQHGQGLDVTINDRTESTLMLAVQGPTAIPTLKELIPVDVGDLKRYHFTSGSYMSIAYTVFRSGYTGEDGVELVLPAMAGGLMSGFLADSLAKGEKFRAAGLGARDTLRLEAGMPLYGHELTEETDSLSAGLTWCVDLDKDFIGAEALRAVASQGAPRRLVGLELQGRRIARQGAVITAGSGDVGRVTSGTMSPTLERSIAMGYVDASSSEVGTVLGIPFSGGRTAEARVVKLPFYKRPTG